MLPSYLQRESTKWWTGNSSICGHQPFDAWGKARHMKGLASSMHLCPAVATGIRTHLRPIRKKIQSEFINPNNLWTDLISLVVGFPVLLLPFGGQVFVLRRSELFHTVTISSFYFDSRFTPLAFTSRQMRLWSWCATASILPSQHLYIRMSSPLVLLRTPPICKPRGWQ